MNKKTYFLVSIVELAESMINQSLCTEKYLRYSNEKNKVVLKFNTAYPDTMVGYTKYTHTEILTKMGEAEWKKAVNI